MASIYRQFNRILKPFLWPELLGFILTLGHGLSLFAAPMVSRYLIDEVIPANSIYKIYAGLGIFLVVCVSHPIISYGKDLVFLKITEKITLNIRADLFQNIVRTYLRFFDHTVKGEIISRLTNDGSVAGQVITDFFANLIGNLIFILIIMGGMFFLSMKITLIVLGALMVYLLIDVFLYKKFIHLSEETYRNFDQFCSVGTQTIDKIVTIKSFQMEKKVIGIFEEILNRCYRTNITTASLGILLNNTASLLVATLVCIIYGLGSLAVMKKEMTIGTVIALGLYFQLLTRPLFEVLSKHINFHKSMAVFKRIEEYHDLPIEVSPVDTGRILSGPIRINNLWFAYDDDSPALQGITMDIPERKLTALIGQSGSGKSTLVKLLMGFYQPSYGSISIGDVAMDQIGVDTLRKNIGYVSQDIDLFTMSIADNIRCGRPNASDEEIIGVCEKLGIHHKIMSLPDKYQSMVSERINLSGGERQRIAIARALIKKPSILVLDELTSFLDPENEAKTMDILENVTQECTVIVISHKIATIEKADLYFVFENGQIIGNGKKGIS